LYIPVDSWFFSYHNIPFNWLKILYGVIFLSRYEFFHDIELIYKNSLQYNGETSEYTLKAKKLVETTQETLDEYADHLEGLEMKIREAQQRAIDQVTY
jgi:hypothetical protein